MRVLLFDIDGTLIRSGGAGKAAMEAGLRSAFGVVEIRDRVKYSGRTDPGIGRELLELHDVEPSEANLAKLHTAYLSHLPDALREMHGEVLPGVDAALRRERQGAVVGLLTGNIRRGAEIKLKHFDLWHHFAFGGFADGLPNRDDVARRALSEAEAHVGKPINPCDVWVIGDTPLDVQCARAIGAHAVVVATGWHAHEELVACNPDHLLPDFTHAGDLLSQWGWI
jgi:phosphoglycolate phosphatase-like HAD superfamily hydrolase